MPSHISASRASVEVQDAPMTVPIVLFKRLGRDRLPDPTVQCFLFFDLNSPHLHVSRAGRLCRKPPEISRPNSFG
jgi:hypothetical protein